VGGEAGEPGVELLAGEVPCEGFGDLVVERFEAGEALLELVKVIEVVRGQDLALHDREVNLDLVEP
jgi:hypothetical protein